MTKRLFKSAESKHLIFTWVIMAAMVGGLTFLTLSLPPKAASGDAFLATANTTGLTSAGVQTNPTMPHLIAPPSSMSSTLEESIEATAHLSYTNFLPLVLKGYWTCPENSFGVQVTWIGPDTAMKIAQMGACWVRIPLYWYLIEPANTTPEHYRWLDGFDWGLAELSRANIPVILTLTDNPSWAATYRNGPIDKVSINELVEFMVAAVEHYGAPPYNIKYWEFYNEPDNGNEYLAEKGSSFFGTQPEVYVDMLAAVYQPMKAADPHAQIVLGGVAYDYWTDQGGPFIRDFLDKVLENGGANYFDVMNFHYYYAFRSNWESYGHDIIGKVTYLQDKLASYGVDKPLICTEAGIPSDATVNPPSNDEIQSRYVAQLFVRSRAVDLGFTIWFMLSDIPGMPPWRVGLLDSNMQPKPSYYAFTTLSRQLSKTQYVRTLGLAETGAESIEAYEFLTRDGLTRIIAAWTNDDSYRPMSFSTDRVVMVDKFGGEATISDKDDGHVDGRVWVTIGPSPVYLRISQ